MSFIAELKRRNVFRVGIAYVVVSWLVAQIADLVLDNIESPAWVMQTLMLVLALGFPFALIFAWAFELTPEGLKKEKDVDRSKSITQTTGRKLDYTIITILVFALGYFAYDKFVLDPARDAALVESAQVEQAAGQEGAAGKTIAVLPFVNMSPDPDQEYFSDGISEEILNALAKVQELQVSGRTSSFAFKGQSQDLRLIGETLGVGHILEGSVRKSGNTVRITAQLIRVDNGFHLWSETYDRELDNVFAIQDEISAAILHELKATLLDGESATVKAVRTNTEAYELYLLAKQRMYERTGPTIESAAELLDRAIAIDPEYAPAYAQRAIAELLLSEGAGSYGNIPLKEAQSRSKLYLDKALQLDPNLAEAWAGMGLHELNSLSAQNWQQAIVDLEKALAINPGLIDASNWLHNAYQATGQPGKGRDVVMNMVERDPLYRPGIRNAINSYVWFGEHDKGFEHLERIQPLIPNDATIQSSEAALYQSLGQTARALELSESSVALQPSNSVARLTLSFGLLNTQQYERVVEMGEEWHPIMALTLLDRTEEASILAFKRADELADVPTLFTFLNMTNRSDELVTYLEERWDSLDALRADFPNYGGVGDFIMIDVALAYSRAGNPERFDQAMSLAADAHEAMLADGVNNFVFFMAEASRLALGGDVEASLNYLDRAISRGYTGASRLSFEWPALQPLEGDPRYEAIQARMVEHVNSEREKLGLEPVST